MLLRSRCGEVVGDGGGFDETLSLNQWPPHTKLSRFLLVPQDASDTSLHVPQDIVFGSKDKCVYV